MKATVSVVTRSFIPTNKLLFAQTQVGRASNVMIKVHIPPDLIIEQLKGIHLNKEIKASILASLIQSHFRHFK